MRRTRKLRWAGYRATPRPRSRKGEGSPPFRSRPCPGACRSRDPTCRAGSCRRRRCARRASGPSHSIEPGVSESRGHTFGMAISPTRGSLKNLMFSRALYCGSAKISAIELTGPHGTSNALQRSISSASGCFWVHRVTQASTSARSRSLSLTLPHLPSPASPGSPCSSARRAKILSDVQAMAIHLPSLVG